eukprot:SAG11_NODE_37595_length_256_cov_0.656051_1_plen_67_part_10
MCRRPQLKPWKGGEPKVPKAEKRKEPEGPKKPMSTYFLWMAENREAAKKEHPDSSITELAKILGDKW